MTSVLVTGGAGFIGSHLVHKLVELGEDVIVVDNLSFGKLENLNDISSKIDFVRSDIRDKQQMSDCMGSVKTIFHLAALKTVPFSFKNPLDYHDVNINGTLNLLEVASDKKVSKFIFSSSSSVYGDSETLPKKEVMCPNPLSPYAVTKIAGEYYVRLFSKLGLNTLIFRYFNVYGPKQDPASEYAAVIPKFISSCFTDEIAKIYGDGRQTRDFSYVDDVVNANLLAHKSKKSFNGQTLNIAGGEQISIAELFQIISDLTNSKKKPNSVPERQGDIKDSLADISFAKEIIDWSPKTSLMQGLEKTIDYFKP